MAAAFVQFGFDDRARKPGDGLHADVRRHLDGAAKHGAGKFGLLRVKGILIKRADGGNANVPRFGF